MARRNTSTRENAIPGALSGNVTRRTTPGHPDTIRAASSRRRSTLDDDANVKSMVMGRKTDESTRTHPVNPKSQSDDVGPRCATTRLQPSAIKYGGNTNGTVSNHINPERSGRSDFPLTIPAGTPNNPQTPLGARAKQMLLPNTGHKPDSERHPR